MSTEEYDNFDILAWWEGREAGYPVLSVMARDTKLQSFYGSIRICFSTCGRVISLRRTRLSSEAMEMCICLKDHLDAVDRKQDQTTLEEEIEPKIHEEEVEEGLSSKILNEELTKR
ncbi:hypothetical protein QVD17_39544 [Tagetes erecta]|uniref:HAT C-terminal dimerisation domain-containing protein n=1 Tax=Tagetes erecta TaxID=13708 RepID=A0AAD8JNR4_TARER|nr:hypothetical protein QVD17_39544 [Tagetes erecta]